MNPSLRLFRLAPCFAATALASIALGQSSTDFTGFVTGASVNGQGGWGSSNPAWDERVVDDGTGNIVWRVSNAVTSGSFGDMPFAPRPGGVPADTVNDPDNSMPLNFAGESSTGAANNRFVSTLRFRSATGAAQPGLFVSLSPDNGSGGRVGYVGLSDNGSTGLDVITYTVSPVDGGFIGPVTIATVDYTSWHDLRIEIDFANGDSNDIVRLYVNNTLVHTGDTWEDYYTFNQAALHPLGVPAQTMLFRLGGTAVPSVLGGGFFFDDVTVALASATDVSLVPTDTCVEGSTLTVNLDLTQVANPELVVGGQFFLEYDTAVLSFASAAPGDAPFTFEVYENVNAGLGHIDYAVGVPGGGPGTGAPTTMAVLTFNVLADVCSTSNLVNFRTPANPFPPTRVTNAMGAAIATATTDLPSIRLDDTAPVLAVPSSVTVHADAGTCEASATTVENGQLNSANGWSFGGDASIVLESGNYALQIDSDADAPGYGFVSHEPSVPFLFSALNNLSADYQMLAGCFHLGAPRFSVRVDADNTGDVSAGDRNIFVYWGSLPNYTDCPPLNTWLSTGNLALAGDARFDTGQLPGGTFYHTRAQANALAGGMQVLRVSVVMDGVSGGAQSMLVDNIQIQNSVNAFLTDPVSTDNCTGMPGIVGVRDDMAALTDPYPVGTTTITWTATDECGNQTSQNQTVTVLGSSLVDVAVQLESAAAGPFTRCITFVFHDSGDCPNVQTVEEVMTFTGGLGTATIEVPCGFYDCITARDRLHTLRRTDETLQVVGTNYAADFTGADQLIGGNLNDDYVIDILDFGAFVGQYGGMIDANTDCLTSGPHADINGDNQVGTSDYTYIGIHFFNFREPDCCMALATGPGGEGGGLNSISTHELRKTGRADLVPADLNNDGSLDVQDIEWFLTHGADPCAADFDRDGEATTADVFSFLSVWFAGDLRSDTNRNDAVEVNDIFAFLSTWFGGCN